MKKLIFIFSLFYALSCTAQGRQKDAGRVALNMLAQQESWNKGDVAGFMKYYWNNDSLKFIGHKGITYGWQQTLDNYLKAYPTKEAMGELAFTIIEATALSGDAVYVIGKWELKKEKPAGGYFTLLWKKINGAWVIVADHTS